MQDAGDKDVPLAADELHRIQRNNVLAPFAATVNAGPQAVKLDEGRLKRSDTRLDIASTSPHVYRIGRSSSDGDGRGQREPKCRKNALLQVDYAENRNSSRYLAVWMAES